MVRAVTCEHAARGPSGFSKFLKGVCFQVRKMKVENLGLLHKTKLVSDPERLTCFYANILFHPAPRPCSSSMSIWGSG